MADTFDNIKRIAKEIFFQRLGANVSDWQEVADVKTNDAATLELADHYGITAFALQVAGTTPTPVDQKSSKSSTTPVAREIALQHTEQDIIDNPEILMNEAGGLADASASTIATNFWDVFQALDTTVHPENGNNYTAVGGGVVYYADNFQLPVLQGNLLDASLSDASLSAALTKMRAYKNKAGLSIRPAIANPDLRLCVPDGLTKFASDLVNADQVYDGSQVTSKYFNGIKVVPFASSDPNDWGLVWKPKTPLNVWIRKKPWIRIETLPGSGHIMLYSAFIAEPALNPFEFGVIWSKVA